MEEDGDYSKVWVHCIISAIAEDTYLQSVYLLGYSQATLHIRRVLFHRSEEIFQAPVEEGDENEECEGTKKPSKDGAGGNDVVIGKNSRKMESGSQAKDSSKNGVVFIGGCKLCKRCGNPLED